MRRAIITGGTGGLGSAITSLFRENGWEVIQLGRHDLDLSDQAAVDNFFHAEACELLVCAAGMAEDAPLARIPEKSWDDVLAVNYTAAERCALAAIPGMAERGGGQVIFISSHAAIHPAIGQVSYATAKAALIGLGTSLAESWGSKGIRVNVVLPGFLETAMTAQVSTKRKNEVIDTHVLGNLNTTDAAADFVFFLHGRLPHTSGQVFQLDSRRGFL